MKLESAAKVKYGIWGLIVGAGATMLVGFIWGGWTTAGTASAMSDKAVVASQAAVCVAQFVTQPNHVQKLKEFSDVSTWMRPEYIEKGGWDKMPGQDKATADVSRACAEGLDLLAKK